MRCGDRTMLRGGIPPYCMNVVVRGMVVCMNGQKKAKAKSKVVSRRAVGARKPVVRAKASVGKRRTARAAGDAGVRDVVRDVIREELQAVAMETREVLEAVRHTDARLGAYLEHVGVSVVEDEEPHIERAYED